MQCLNLKPHKPAFTLIEMLIIIPFVMLVVSSMIVAVTVLSTEALQVRAKAEVTYELQTALDSIERNVSKTMRFPSSITNLTSGQGSDNGTAPFTYTAGTTSDRLLLALPATDKNYFDTTRSVLYATGGTLNTCASGNASTNPVYPVTFVYFVSGGSLYERTIITNDKSYTQKTGCTGTSSVSVWQRPTCAENITGTECTSSDAKLIDKISSFTISYLNADGTSAASPSTASGVQVSLTTTQNIAGQDISITLSFNTQSQNI